MHTPGALVDLPADRTAVGVVAQMQQRHEDELQDSLTAEKSARAQSVQDARSLERALEFVLNLFAEAAPVRARGKIPTAQEIFELAAERIGSDLLDEPLTRARILLTIGRGGEDLGSAERARRPAHRGVTHD